MPAPPTKDLIQAVLDQIQGLPGPSPFTLHVNLVDLGDLNPDDLIQEPVTSGGDSSLWDEDDDDQGDNPPAGE